MLEFGERIINIGIFMAFNTRSGVSNWIIIVVQPRVSLLFHKLQWESKNKDILPRIQNIFSFLWLRVIIILGWCWCDLPRVWPMRGRHSPEEVLSFTPGTMGRHMDQSQTRYSRASVKILFITWSLNLVCLYVSRAYFSCNGRRSSQINWWLLYRQ